MKKAVPLISVIVPVYKVEKYLDDCVQSILRQTYDNLEIILVDDGSPDQCPRMCDNYAAEDVRVIVIHKQNGGLSSARNAGMAVATGEYIAFIDSDDWIAENMCERLISAFSAAENIGIVSDMFHRVLANGEYEVLRHDWVITKPRLLNAEELSYSLANESISHTVWNKLFKKSCIGDLKFWEGCINEDWPFMFELSLRMQADGYTFYEIPDCLNYYREREGNITGNGLKLSQAIAENYWECINKYPQVGERIIFSLRKRFVFSIVHHAFYKGVNKEQDNMIKKNFNRLSFAEYMEVASARQKLAYMALKYIPFLWKFEIIRKYCNYII